MKEIDKIRIRQWNQDNPYIQMKNLENAQPGYRVHTVNDDHHLYELPLETQNIILDWVFWNFYPAQKIYPHLTSDDLKEVLYKRTQIHLYNNQFKEAMLINGFWPRDPSELNWVFHIQASSPAIRTQADGYPGIPIIGRQELNGPSRYCSSIGHQVVFRLGWWSTRFPTGFLVSRGTLDTRCQSHFSLTGLSPSVAGLPMPFC